MHRLNLACLTILILTTLPATAADANRAEQRFAAMCAACHAIDPGQKKMAPHLKGIVGRKAASVEGANYSPALKGSAWAWDKTTLDAYLRDPKKVLPGTTMMTGVANAEDRADIIAFLETLK